MGTAFTAVADDPSAIYWNPGALFESLTSSVSLEYNNIDDLTDNERSENDKGSVLFLNGVKLFENFAHGFSLRRVSLSKTGVSSTDLTYAGAFVIKRDGDNEFLPRFNAGLDLTLFNRNINNRSYTGISYTLGTICTIFENKISGGEAPNWSVKLGATYWPQANLKDGGREVRARPDYFAGGLAISKTLNSDPLANHQRITVATDYVSTKNGDINKLGVDYMVVFSESGEQQQSGKSDILKQLNVRAGAQYSKNFLAYSVGLGLGLWKNINLEIAYEYFDYEKINVNEPGNIVSAAVRYLF